MPVQSQQLEHVGNMFTVNNEDTGTTPLSSCLILNSCHTLFLCLTSQTKALKTKSFFPFNFSVTNMCVAIRLAKDGTRMGRI